VSVRLGTDVAMWDITFDTVPAHPLALRGGPSSCERQPTTSSPPGVPASSDPHFARHMEVGITIVVVAVVLGALGFLVAPAGGSNRWHRQIRRELTMRRILFALLAIALGLGAVVATPAQAAPRGQQRHVAPASVTAQSDSQVWGSSPSQGRCNFVSWQATGTYAAGPGAAQRGTLYIEGCVDSGADFVLRGTFRMVAANGAVLTGTATGTFFFPPRFVLHPTSGTRQLGNVRGPIVFEPDDGFSGQITGTLR
jgi:hypothetical protein